MLINHIVTLVLCDHYRCISLLINVNHQNDCFATKASFCDLFSKLRSLIISNVISYPSKLRSSLPILGFFSFHFEKEGVDPIGTRRRTGIKRMLIGSIASAVVTYAHCAVMIVDCSVRFDFLGLGHSSRMKMQTVD